MERELRSVEERWMERTRDTMQERDILVQKLQQLEEQVESAVAYRLEIEESRNRMKNQLDSVQRDYEETMAERSTVLEENTRMCEERDRLRQTYKNISNKLEHTTRLLHLNLEEAMSANEKRTEALEKLQKLQTECGRLAEERDAALREAKAADGDEPITDLWNTHTIEVPYPKPNLGIVLSGGKTEDRCSISTPIYVKDILTGSPLENKLKRLDHILMVNDIDVMEMDQRSVIDILKNSHHLKILIRRRGNASSIRDVTFISNRDIGIELSNGVFVNAVDAGGVACRLGVEPGHRIVHVNDVPVYDAKHAEQLIRCEFKARRVNNNSNKLIFGRQSGEKPRVVAKANIGNAVGEPAFLRQGSLRVPSQQHVSPQLVRYGSLSGSTSPRWVTVPRKAVRLCGGNAMGILSEATAGELQEGDLILEIDGFNVRGATLEEATEALLDSLSEMAELHVEDGGDRLNRLRLGADGDSFYVRINVDRSSENKDELDIKAGEIVFVDNTMFMGQHGKWRAWKVDREGRQRENGIIPSATYMERSDIRGRKNRIPLARPIYERVERVPSSRRRPVVLFGPLLTPIIQTLLDDSTRRETLYDVITASSIHYFAEMGYAAVFGALAPSVSLEILFYTFKMFQFSSIHCIVDVSPSGIQRMHSLHVYPIVIRVKFKSAKQIKDIKEDFCREKITTKQAKDLIDKVGFVHISMMIVALIEHEQKKTIWMTSPQ
uniref:PDZ domain-containing protein n=1 Tax=Angiostrongylus cantonensis TaxID=6313 RepID=A0A158P6F5_ANGCA